MDTAPAALVEHAERVRPARGSGSTWRFPAVRWPAALIAAAALIIAQLVLRGWVAGSGYFYWDDLILIGRAGSRSLWSAELLFYDHDGHFMPAAFATAWLVTAIAPLSWAGPVLTMLVMQAAASIAVLRMLVVLLGPRRILLVPLIFYLFCPVTVPAFAWWAAALNTLPLQFALAWVIADAVLLVRTGRRRYAVTGVAVVAVALLFFEKSVIVPFVAFAVAVLARYVVGERGAVRAVVRRGAALWIGSALVLGCWLVAYLAVVDLAYTRTEPRDIPGLLHAATSRGIVPTLVGGPWSWERWVPAAPWATPPAVAVALSWAALVAVVVWTIRSRPRTAAVWLTLVGYFAVALVPVAVARGGPNSVDELMQSLRYLADTAVVLTAAGALLVSARPRRPGKVSRPPAAVVVGLAAAFVVSSSWSTLMYVRSWSDGTTERYLTTVAAELGALDAPLLEQEVPWTVLNPTAYPQNLASRVLSPIAGPTIFADSTPRLRMITDTGDIVDAQVWWNRSIRPGPAPGCGYRVQGSETVRLPLDGPMLAHEWTVQLNYLASRDGTVALGFEYGDRVAVPVQKGLHTVYVRVVGSGSLLRIAAQTPGLDLCIASGPVGVASYDN
ncbi:hypothetical protein [Nocardia cyriacigeorgica]|uniref:hypothetical protein n=1 Tax=Nocardia cyriacigeorgica TaxID=135487 RepID=UPI001E4124DC|nr:hypothetical protein [Nocardia cyriacigeorgica]